MILSTFIAVLMCAVPEEPPALSISTGDTRLDLHAEVNGLQIVGLSDEENAHSWISRPVSMPFMGRIGWKGEERPALWVFQKSERDASSGILRVVYENTTPRLLLKSIWQARPGGGPIEHHIEIENLSGDPVTLFHQDSLTLPSLSAGDSATLWWIQRGGGNASTQGGTFSKSLTEDLDLQLLSNCDDGATPSPWLAIQTEKNGGVYLGWEFSGLGRIRAQGEKSPEGVSGAPLLTISTGLLPDFKTDIAANETFVVPTAFVGCYTGDLDEGAYRLHQWFLRYLRPALPDDIADPTLAYNLYLDAGGPNALEADVMRSAAFCRDLGFETFMPDAMWFPACGDWRWDPARFPEGIGPVERFVHGSGMKLALWCAWTNGGNSEDPDALSALGAVSHPDWFESTYPADWKPGPFYGARLCLASPEAKEWAFKKTQWLVSHHGLDYLKHDCGPIITQCQQSNHRHRYGVDASYWAVMGYYEVQDRLRALFPRLILENCSGGGHIKDYGAMSRTHYTVTTDTLSNLPDRQSLYDSTFAFPPLVLQAYTYERFYKVPGDEPSAFLWRSAMMGAWQIDPTNTRIWTEEERDCARRHAEIYKQWIRPMLKDVKVHHILPRPDGKNWDGMFYWSPGLLRGTVYLFRPDAEESSQTIRLKGLEPEKTYWVWCEDGSVAPGIRTGADLMEKGLAVTLPVRYSSDLVYLREESLGKPEGLELPGAFVLQPPQTQSNPFTASADLAWAVSPNARSYHVLVSDAQDFASVRFEKSTVRPACSLSDLPASQTFWWKVEAVSYGGTRPNEGESGSFTTPAVKPLRGVTFVSDMPWAVATAGADNTVHRDTNYGKTAISIAGKLYPKGVWTHAFPDTTPADVMVEIASRSLGRFIADAGVEDSAGQGSVQFQVFVDGVLKAESPVMHAGTLHPFDVPIAGANQVTLRVLNGGDGYACDHAAWGFARFIENNIPDPLAEK